MRLITNSNLNRDMSKRTIAAWAFVTFLLAWVLWAVAVPRFNRATIDSTRSAITFLYIPIFAQMIWFAMVALYSKARMRREPLTGTLVGFGLELAVLIFLILLSASAHY